MGYQLHITRIKDWDDTETSDISMEEWLSYITTDPELDLTEESSIWKGKELQFQNNPGYCEWIAHPTEIDPDGRPWLSYWMGKIHTKNPDSPTIRKMMEIAIGLKARVMGDDGEIYSEEMLIEMENEMKKWISPAQSPKRPWWKFW